jgi:hypothetical protein
MLDGLTQGMGSRTAIKSNRIEEAQDNNLNDWEMMIENCENKRTKTFGSFRNFSISEESLSVANPWAPFLSWSTPYPVPVQEDKAILARARLSRMGPLPV